MSWELRDSNLRLSECLCVFDSVFLSGEAYRLKVKLDEMLDSATKLNVALNRSHLNCRPVGRRDWAES